MLRRLGLGAAIVLLWISAALAGNWSAGDKVQVYADGTWFDAVILGPGAYDGYFSVQFAIDGSTSSARDDNIRAVTPATGPVASDVVAGDYTCVGFGNADFRWYLRINADGTYQQLTPDLPAGNFGFVAEQSAIMFIDGPYFDNGWFGKVTAGPDGRQQIVLRAIASEQKGPRVDEFANIYCGIGG